MTRRKIQIAIGCLLIILSLVVSQIPTGYANADQAKASDFEMDGTTLIKYTGTAKAVSVPDSVKVISPECFLNNSEMTSLTIPDSVKEIGMNAFTGCNKLTEVKIGNNVETIGNAAFSECTSLEKVTIGKELSSLGTGVFLNDRKLKEVSFDKDSKYICVDGVIYNKDKTELVEVLSGRADKTYKMPSTVTDIRPYAFYGCKKIEDITISNNIVNIPPYSFSLCTGISEISIPYSVRSIDIKAFENCVNLRNVIIKESVNYIDRTAFDGCSKLNMIAPVGSYAEKWFESFETSDVVIIENEDNDDVPEKEEEEYKETKVPVDEIPIKGQFGESIVVGRQAVFIIDNTLSTVNGGVSNPSNTENYSEIILNNDNLEGILKTENAGKGLSIPKFAIIGDTIAGKAFYQDSKLKEYEIVDEITTIDDFAFSRSALSEIRIPSSVTHIGYGAFYHCDELSTIYVPESVTEIEPFAFAKTRMMENWLAYGSSDFMIMGDGILVAYRGNASQVYIPDGVKQIGPGCFMDHVEITEVSIPESVSIIGEDAFNGCSRLKNIVGGLAVQVIKDRAFAKCPVETVRVWDSVTEIGLGAFDLRDTVVSQDRRVAFFYSDNIPKLTYEKTATRLTNEDYRTDALSGINVAIINGENILRNETVLDRNVSGFSGVICVISEDNNEYTNGTLKIIDCTMSQKEAESITIPETVYVFGKGYNFNKEELDSVLSMALEGKYNKDQGEDKVVSIPGSDKRYTISVKTGSASDKEIKEAYKRIYGDTVPANFTSYDITVKETDNEVELSKFGKLSLDINLKIPDNMPSQNLHVICIDENNQLEDLPYEITDSDGKLYVSFAISHAGAYGLYSFNSTAVSLVKLDETPDTGDYIHPKWFLSLGLMALGLALIIIRKKTDINI